MRTYSLLLKKLDGGAELKKAIQFSAPKNMSIEGIIDIANYQLSCVVILANLQVQNENGDVYLKTAHLKLKKVNTWQYFENRDMLVGITKTFSDVKLPELDIFIFIKEISDDN